MCNKTSKLKKVLFLFALYTNAFDQRRYTSFYFILFIYLFYFYFIFIFIYLFFFPGGGAILGFSLANLEVRLPKVKFFLKIKSHKSSFFI